MVNGFFTQALKDALLRDLNVALFSIPPNSFVPTFKGHGLRFGSVWFLPDNEPSSFWLKEKLSQINEKAGDFSFIIEKFTLYQKKVCLHIPWDSVEKLGDLGILKRLALQNPFIQLHKWKLQRASLTTAGKRFLICCIDSDTLKLLEAQKFILNYGFQKVSAKVTGKTPHSKSGN